MNELVVVDKATEWLRLKALVLDSISSPITRRVYNLGLDEFIRWYTEEPRLGFTKATVSAWRVALEARKLGPISINVRLTAVRKLAVEAADNGLLAPALAAGIARIKGVRAQGVRTGNWLTLKQAQALLGAPDIETPKGLRDRAILAVLLGCGLRRSEVAALTFEHVQQRDGRWCIIDLVGKHRVVYLSLITGILSALVPDKQAPNALHAQGVTFQVLVAEDAALDALIQSEDPSNDLIYIPGFSGALQAESFQDWPLVWFPILGEGKVSQLERVMNQVIPANAEICPVLPHPSRDPRRADRLLGQYRQSLFDARQTPTGNILLAHEAHPFEAYRQLLGAMLRYQRSMAIMGGCRLVVTPLASKLITIGTALACFEMQPADKAAQYRVAIPYAEPTRYLAAVQDLRQSEPEISALLLTGDAYDEGLTAGQV